MAISHTAKPPRLADVPPAVERRPDRATIKLCALALKLKPPNRPAFAPFAQPPAIRQIRIHWRTSRSMAANRKPAAITTTATIL